MATTRDKKPRKKSGSGATKTVKKTISDDQKKSSGKPPRSLKIASDGIQTGGDFAKMMSALMSDLIEGSITPQVANATVNAGGKLLKIVEMQLRYGKAEAERDSRQLRLVE